MVLHHSNLKAPDETYQTQQITQNVTSVSYLHCRLAFFTTQHDRFVWGITYNTIELALDKINHYREIQENSVAKHYQGWKLDPTITIH